MSSRRQFIRLVPAAACGLLVARDALAQAKTASAAPANKPGTTTAAPVLVDEKESQAVALGYVADAAKVDKAKHTKWSAEQRCASCMLYQGAPDSSSGACALFPARHVEAKGWCTAWVRKA